jgi:hypothetical protein
MERSEAKRSKTSAHLCAPSLPDIIVFNDGELADIIVHFVGFENQDGTFDHSRLLPFINFFDAHPAFRAMVPAKKRRLLRRAAIVYPMVEGLADPYCDQPFQRVAEFLRCMHLNGKYCGKDRHKARRAIVRTICHVPGLGAAALRVWNVTCYVVQKHKCTYLSRYLSPDGDDIDKLARRVRRRIVSPHQELPPAVLYARPSGVLEDDIYISSDDDDDEPDDGDGDNLNDYFLGDEDYMP